jgi:hypothetical protein
MYAVLYEAVKEFFGRAKHLGAPVPVVFAGPDRAHEELTRIAKQRAQGKLGKATEQQIEDRPAAVPFMSIWMTSPKFDPSRFSPAKLRGFDRDTKAGTAKVMRWPRPVMMDVQVDLWCGSDGGHVIAQQVEAQIEMLFVAESAYPPIDWTQPKWYRPPFNTLEHAKVMGKSRLHLVADGWSDTSDLEVGEGPKEVRRTWAGHLEAFLPYRPSEGRLVREITVEINDDTTPPVTIDTAVVGGED